MSALIDERPTVVGPVVDDGLGEDLIAHLGEQLISAQRLLQVVLEQGVAIRERDVQEVVRYAGEMQVEMQRRGAIENTRSRLLERAGVRLGITAASVSLDLLTRLLDPGTAALAREHSTRLRGLLEEIKREHTVNRALMQQELAFLDHLLRLIDGDGSGAYQAGGAAPTASATGASQRRVFDLEV